ncbi:hypothetical protein TNCV_4935711 [Trichonephila clavipes]|nr:hypothetical protein TNCV_4935711 [Trichonephila clavipes]
MTCGRRSRVVKVSDRGWPCHEFEPVPLKTRCVREQCTLNLSRAQMSSRWCGVVVRLGDEKCLLERITCVDAIMQRNLLRMMIIVELRCRRHEWEMVARMIIYGKHQRDAEPQPAHGHVATQN